MSIATAKLNKPEVIQVYSRTAPVYDIWGILTESKARKRVLALARIRDGESILEVAVGTGLTFHEILKANPHGHNTGIDLTPAILEKARQRAAREPGEQRVSTEKTVRRACAPKVADRTSLFWSFYPQNPVHEQEELLLRRQAVDRRATPNVDDLPIYRPPHTNVNARLPVRT